MSKSIDIALGKREEGQFDLTSSILEIPERRSHHLEEATVCCYLLDSYFNSTVRKTVIHFPIIQMMLSPAQTRMKAVDDDECG